MSHTSQKLLSLNVFLRQGASSWKMIIFPIVVAIARGIVGSITSPVDSTKFLACAAAFVVSILFSTLHIQHNLRLLWGQSKPLSKLFWKVGDAMTSQFTFIVKYHWRSITVINPYFPCSEWHHWRDKMNSAREQCKRELFWIWAITVRCSDSISLSNWRGSLLFRV